MYLLKLNYDPAPSFSLVSLFKTIEELIEVGDSTLRRNPNVVTYDILSTKLERVVHRPPLPIFNVLTQFKDGDVQCVTFQSLEEVTLHIVSLANYNKITITKD